MFGYNRKIYLYNHCSGAIERVLKKLEGIVGLSFFPYFFLSCPACSSAAAPAYFLFIYIFVRPQSEVPEHRPIYICVRVCLVYGLCLSLSERKNLLLEYIYILVGTICPLTFPASTKHWRSGTETSFEALCRTNISLSFLTRALVFFKIVLACPLSVSGPARHICMYELVYIPQIPSMILHNGKHSHPHTLWSLQSSEDGENLICIVSGRDLVE